MQRKSRARPNSVYRVSDEDKIKFDAKAYWLAKHRKTPIEILDIDVPCQGKHHTIRCEFPGRMTMLHHKDKDAEDILYKLSGDTTIPACLQFMEAFKKNPLDVCRGRYNAMRLLAAREWVKSHRDSNLSAIDQMTLSQTVRTKAWLNTIYNDLETKINKKWEPKYNPNRWNYSRKEDTNNNRHIAVELSFRVRNKTQEEMEKENEA